MGGGVYTTGCGGAFLSGDSTCFGWGGVYSAKMLRPVPLYSVSSLALSTSSFSVGSSEFAVGNFACAPLGIRRAVFAVCAGFGGGAAAAAPAGCVLSSRNMRTASTIATVASAMVAIRTFL